MTTRAQVIPQADGGTGGYSWYRSKAYLHTYVIRRGPDVIGKVSLDESAPPHDEVMERICRALAEAAA